MKSESMKKIVLDCLIGIVLFSGLVWVNYLRDEPSAAEQSTAFAQQIIANHVTPQR